MYKITKNYFVKNYMTVLPNLFLLTDIKHDFEGS